VYAFLRSHNALIVHFSSEAKGEVIDVQRRLPLDLRRVIGGKCQQVGLSCSLVKPGDKFGVPGANGTGHVRVVLGLKRTNHLLM
jgi:hypothetical protein